MARANDNWERLMGAVMRRNRDWEMFHAQSRTPSMSSAASSTDDPFLDLSDDKFESRRYAEDQNLEALTPDEIYGAQGIGNGMMARRFGAMEKTEGRLFDEIRMIHGGGLSQHGKFSYGYASYPGRRPMMEDFYETRIDDVDGEIVGLFGVFDGHGGGARAAEFVKNNLFSNLIMHPKFISDTKSAIADAYCHTDRELLKSENIQNKAGSTACTAIVVAGRLLVANVGDSRAVICRAGKAIAVSEDHKPNRSDESRRIRDAGGFVMWTGGAWRVAGVVAVSRAFGHRMLKHFVVTDPDIEEEKVDKTLELLILASNGLWDTVSNEEAVSMTKPIQDPEAAAQMLMQKASQRGSTDNVTVIIVRFCGSSA